MASFFDRIRKLQASLVSAGLSRSVLALPAPKLLALSAPTSSDLKEDIVYEEFITEQEIVAVSRDLFTSGFYNGAVLEAFKAVDIYIKKKSDNGELSGSKLMECVFSSGKPHLVWSDRKTQSEKDEHHGYQRLFAGSMLGIRNPCAHEHHWIDDPINALECIVLAQHLLRKAKRSRLHSKKDTGKADPSLTS